MVTKKQYTKEFKLDAVSLVLINMQKLPGKDRNQH
jgi:hypothetical protein